MSQDNEILRIANFYDNLSGERLNKEMGLYSKAQMKEIRNICASRIWNWSTLDENDRRGFKRWFYKALGLSFLGAGVTKIATDQSLQKLIGWNPAWNKKLLVKVIIWKKSVPFLAAISLLLMPEIMQHSARIGLKYYHIGNYMRFEAQKDKIAEEQGTIRTKLE